MSKRDVVVLGAARSAIGTFNGGLADIEPAELAGMVMKEAVKRSGVDPKAINYVTVGNCIPTESRYPYVARVASIQAGLPMESVAMAVNRLCSSGLQGIVTTAQKHPARRLRLRHRRRRRGHEPRRLPVHRHAQRRPHGRHQAHRHHGGRADRPLRCRPHGHHGREPVHQVGITREEQDALAVESHRRAAAAIADGRFKTQIVPIVKQTKKGEVVFDTDEHVKASTTMESLAKLKPAFKKDGSVTAATPRASTTARLLRAGRRRGGRRGRPQADGAPGVLRGGRGAERDHGRSPIPATKLALKKGGLTLARWTSSKATKPSRRRPSRGARPGARHEERPTPTAAPSRWATRSAVRAPSWPPRRCTNCTARAAATRW